MASKDAIELVLSYLILFYRFLFYLMLFYFHLMEACLFSNDRLKLDPDGKEGREELEKNRRKGNCNRLNYVRK